MMNYEVVVVRDDDLPNDVKRVIVERPDGDAMLLLAESVAHNWRLMQAWEAMHERPARVFQLRPAG